MFGALTSLTGGGGLSASASSSTGAIGGDTFTQDFGGAVQGGDTTILWVVLAVVAMAVLLIVFKVL